jgi:DNA polymerase III epsilon subunit-like protein
MVMTSSVFWVIDVEGSGSRPPEIVELAMLKLIDFLPTMQRHWLVRPHGPIEHAASRIHGITEVDVIGAPAIEDLSDDIVECLNGVPIVGHNVRVDLDVLSRSVPEWKPHSAIDTLRIAKLLLPGKSSYALDKLGVEFGLDIEAARRTGKNAHSALYDATLTALLFAELLEAVPAQDINGILQEADLLYRPQGNLF